MNKWSRLTINLDSATAKAAKAIARRQRRSFSAYVATLIDRDMAAAETLEEPSTPYITEGPHAPEEKPPDKSGRTTGAGPRHRVPQSA